ncbi:hypothetical protein TNCT_417871 [Trichonephila clavata]|uniref:Uncharacterized protein n=1 Tax=Trichonephila clavata TaxID=2740835 RepID=A0A8X6LLT7_TRICU|nr:hypothetical protein TNCT_417871 [Trichonephila clavata]
MARTLDNLHPKDPPWMNILEEELNFPTNDKDQCMVHKSMEKVLFRAMTHREFYELHLKSAQKNPTPEYQKEITQRQKDIAAVNILIQRLRGELASSFPCPNPDCHAYNKIPDLTQLVDCKFIWHPIDTTHKKNNPLFYLIKRKLIRKVSPSQRKLKN